MAMATPTPGHKVSDNTQRTRALVIIKVYDFKKQGQRMDTFEHRIGCILFKYSKSTYEVGMHFRKHSEQGYPLFSIRFVLK